MSPMIVSVKTDSSIPSSAHPALNGRPRSSLVVGPPRTVIRRFRLGIIVDRLRILEQRYHCVTEGASRGTERCHKAVSYSRTWSEE